jgi:hypothetical protein
LVPTERENTQQGENESDQSTSTCSETDRQASTIRNRSVVLPAEEATDRDFLGAALETIRALERTEAAQGELDDALAAWQLQSELRQGVADAELD